MFKNMGGNISGGNFLGGNFLGENFPGGSLMGGNFRRGNLPGRGFPDTVCNKCHDLLTMAHSLKDIAILGGKCATFRCILIGLVKMKP